MGHFLAAVTVTVGYSDTFADPRGCHCNRRPLYSQLPLQQRLPQQPQPHCILFRAFFFWKKCHGLPQTAMNATLPWPLRTYAFQLWINLFITTSQKGLPQQPQQSKPYFQSKSFEKVLWPASDSHECQPAMTIKDLCLPTLNQYVYSYLSKGAATTATATTA